MNWALASNFHIRKSCARWCITSRANAANKDRIRLIIPTEQAVPSQLRVIAPPPILYIGAFLLGMVSHAVLPLWIFAVPYVSRIPGGLLLVLSAAFARWAFWTMRRVGTPANPKQPSQVLATGGPFQFSRNPIYLAMTGFYLGLALLVNSYWHLILFVPLLALMEWGVIRREEHYLAEKFGEPYTRYKSQVRRWF